MTDLIVSVLILAAYVLACVGWKLRHMQLDRNRARRQWLRKFTPYTMHTPDTTPANVYRLDNYSRKVDAA